MKQLATEKTTLGLRFNREAFNLRSKEEAAKDLLKNPAAPWRDPEEIPYWRKFFITDKAESKGLADGQIRHYITTATLDRDHEIMTPKGANMKYYKENPIVLWGHDQSHPGNVIGKNVEIKHDKKGLKALTQFNLQEAKAAQVYRLYKGGWLKAWSVGFIPLTGHKPEKKEIEKLTIELGETPKPGEVRYIHDKWSLLEYSTVAVPSNPEALTTDVAKSLKLSDDMLEELAIEIKDIGGKDDDNSNKVILDLGDGKQKKEGKTKTQKADEKEEGKKEEDKQDAGIVLKPETTDGYHRIPVSDGHSDHKIRTIDVSKEKKIKALYCVDCKKIITYMFTTSDWSMAEAQDWVDEHTPPSKVETYDEDGVTYYYQVLDGTDQSDDNQKAIEVLSNEIKELREELQAKVGRELSAKNRKLIKTSVSSMQETIIALNELLEATEPKGVDDDGDDKKEKQTFNLQDILQGEKINIDKLSQEISENVDISKLTTKAIKQRNDNKQ